MSAYDDLIAQLDATTSRLLQDYDSGNSEQAWTAAKEVPEAKRKIPGNTFLAGTGRINAGIGTGDIAQRDSSGSITGYKGRNRGSLTPGLDRLTQMRSDTAAGKPLSGASDTPGLDAFHAVQPKDSSGNEKINYSWQNPLIRKPAPVASKPFSISPQQSADFASRIFV